MSKKEKKASEWTVVSNKKKNKPTSPAPAAASLAASVPKLEPPFVLLATADVWPNPLVSYAEPPRAPPGAAIAVKIVGKERDALAPRLDETYGNGVEGVLQTAMDRVLGANTVLVRFNVSLSPELRKDSRRVVSSVIASPAFSAAVQERIARRWGSGWSLPRDSAAGTSEVTVRSSLTAQEVVHSLVSVLVRGGYQMGSGKTVESALTEVSRFLSASFQRSGDIRAITSNAAHQPRFGGIDKEILRYLFAFLDPNTLAIARRVCVAWNRVGSDSRLWTALRRKHPELIARQAIPVRARFYSIQPHNNIVPSRNEGYGYFKGIAEYEHMFCSLYGNAVTVLAINVP